MFQLSSRLQSYPALLLPALPERRNRSSRMAPDWPHSQRQVFPPSQHAIFPATAIFMLRKGKWRPFMSKNRAASTSSPAAPLPPLFFAWMTSPSPVNPAGNQIPVANPDWFSESDREDFSRLADLAAQCREYFNPDRRERRDRCAISACLRANVLANRIGWQCQLAVLRFEREAQGGPAKRQKNTQMLMRKPSPNLNSGFLTLLFGQGNKNCGSPR
jgi:hypothetical protein